MEEVKIDKAEIIKSYKSADTKGKSLLVKLYGKELFVVPKPVKQIKVKEPVWKSVNNLNDIFRLAKVDRNKYLPYPKPKNDWERFVNATPILALVAKVFNEGWIPDWDNNDEKKWFCWFDMRKGGFVFSYTFYGCTFTHSYCGSRLVLVDSERAKRSGVLFKQIHKDLIWVNKKKK